MKAMSASKSPLTSLDLSPGTIYTFTAAQVRSLLLATGGTTWYGGVKYVYLKKSLGLGIYNVRMAECAWDAKRNAYTTPKWDERAGSTP